ncbi:MAG: flagellar assembly protein FliW [Gemmatimonadaceae bacterium]
MTAPQTLEARPTFAPAARDVLTLFGPLRVAEEHVLRFGGGLLGFPDHKEWILLDGARPGTAWLQSLDHQSLAFLLIDPLMVFAAYAAAVPPAIARALDALPSDNIAILALVTMPATRDGQATANLSGPLMVNWRTRRGAQCVLDDGAWSTCEPVPAAVLANPESQSIAG